MCVCVCVCCLQECGREHASDREQENVFLRTDEIEEMFSKYFDRVKKFSPSREKSSFFV